MRGSRTDIAWAAGLFEGEGCIAFRSARDHGVVLRLLTSDEDVLHRFHRIVGCGTIRANGTGAEEHYKPTWTWHVGSAYDVLLVLDAFWSYLGERRQERAAEAIERLAKRDGPRSPDLSDLEVVM